MILLLCKIALHTLLQLGRPCGMHGQHHSSSRTCPPPYLSNDRCVQGQLHGKEVHA